MPIRDIISDLGRVLLDFDNDIFLRHMERFSSLTVPEMRAEAPKYLPVLREFESGRMSPEEFQKRISSILGAAVDQETFYIHYNDIFCVDSPVTSLIKSLRPTYRLILLSNTDVKRYGFITASFPEIFFFDAYVLSYEVGAVKPEPAIYRAALDRAQAKPAECLFIDDLLENVEAANRLGFQTVHFFSGTDLRKELVKYRIVIPA
ncbi:MAG: HAD family phosphatase [Candidatus Aminicenantes bacterium]|nr:HAD family phosphatase [Candidatus Aminicenantes bacterium]